LVFNGLPVLVPPGRGFSCVVMPTTGGCGGQPLDSAALIGDAGGGAHQHQKAAMAANDKSGFWNDWKTQHPRWHRLLVLELAGIAGLLAVGLIWLLGADIWLFLSENSAIVRDLLVGLTALVAFITARAAISQASTARNRHDKQTEADRERRITDSFTKAVELLGSDKLAARLGGIYALERIARESKRDHWPIMETLTAYVRNKAPSQGRAQDASRPNQADTSDEEASVYAVAAAVTAAEGITEAEQGTVQDPTVKPAVDVQAVLTVLTRRAIGHEEKNQCLDLARTNLCGTRLSGTNLSRVDLSGADLREAKLNKANLSKANLDKTDLMGANLYEVNLHGANLSRTSLLYAKLHWANLSRANLYEADLSGANLRRACLNGALLLNAKLAKADLRKADLRNVDLRNVDLSEAELTGADLTGAKLENAMFCHTTMPDGTMNNRDCPPEPAASPPSETTPAPD
jgi:uncharacterized protein YjbI with pentapeptide repeats